METKQKGCRCDMGKIIKTGGVSIGIDDNLDLDKFLKTVAPSASKMMEEEFARIEKEAKAEWPKRKPTKKFKKGKITFKDESKNSWNKFERGIRISRGNIEVFLKNTAPYSWAIKIGVDATNASGGGIFIPQGKRVAQELMVKPLRKSSKKIAKKLADDLVRRF